MAFPRMGTFAFNHVGQLDTPLDGPGDIKTYWDSRGENLKTALNALAAALESVSPGSSGSENIGSAPIAGVLGDTVYEQLGNIYSQLSSVALGSIPNDSLTESQMAADMKKQAGGVAEYDTLATHLTAYTTFKGDAVKFIISATLDNDDGEPDGTILFYTGA